MNTSTEAAARGYAIRPTPRPDLLQGLARRTVLARLAGLADGELTVVDAGQRHRFGRAGGAGDPVVTVTVHDPQFYADVAFAGSIGAGEGYAAGTWSCDDPTGAVRLMLRNRAVLDGLDGGCARLTAPLQQLFHRLNRNTRGGSRRNIAAHYDLGNDFFAAFLDRSMMYSAAVFERPDMTLDEAAVAKLERICHKLALRPTDHVLEIGSGWGGFAIHAASRHGCRVTTTTISREQHALARERVAAAGLADKVTVLLEDYRDLRGRYDKLVSIEMIEAVGHAFYDTFFQRCSSLLAADGLFALQAITIADQRYEQARRSVDFIQRHIFPGSCIPSVAALSASVARASDLRLFHLEDIGPHYATTLQHWRRRLRAQWPALRARGCPEQFLRLWEFYFCYCEGGFAERALGDAQMLFVKPRCRRAPL